MKCTLKFAEGLGPPPAMGFLAYCRPTATEVRGEPSCSLGTKVITSAGREEGVFAEWCWDGRGLVIRNDRLGFFPIYVYRKGNAIGVSPSISKLIALGADSALDYPAIAVALRLGQFIGDDSPFHYIRALPPGATLVWSGGDTSLEVGDRICSSAKAIARADAVERYIQLFRAAICRRTPPDEDFAIPLSGGRDSRHILFELIRTGIRPTYCLTYKTSPEDVKVAVEICSRLQLAHVVVEPTKEPYEYEIKKNWLTNFGVDEGSYPLTIYDTLASRGTTTIFDGIGGDVLSAGLFLDLERLRLFQRGNSTAVAETLLPAGEEGALAKILSPDFISACSRPVAVQRLSREIELHSDAHNPVTSFYFWNRTRRKIALTPYAMLAGISNIFAPYLDHELFDFLSALPAELIIDHAFHTDTISQAYPRLSDIPYESKSASHFDYSRSYGLFASNYSRHALFRRTPYLVNEIGLKSRLALSEMNNRFGASQQWFLRRALWACQLATLANSVPGKAS